MDQDVLADIKIRYYEIISSLRAKNNRLAVFLCKNVQRDKHLVNIIFYSGYYGLVSEGI